MNGPVVRVPAAAGKEAPLCILFNSSGQGYGLFPVDQRSLDWLFKTAAGTPATSATPLMRASAYINLYENMLDRQGLTPPQLRVLDRPVLSHTTQQAILNLR